MLTRLVCAVVGHRYGEAVRHDRIGRLTVYTRLCPRCNRPYRVKVWAADR